MKANAAIILLTAYLVAFLSLLQSNASPLLLQVLFLLFPFALVTTVVIVLKDTSRPYPELGKNDEWGYRDKAKAELGMF